MSADAVVDGLELRAGGVLVDRALAALAPGPLDTPTLAERALGLTGNARAAAAAVFTLLGSDRRFQVDAAGIWSLTATAAAPAGSARGGIGTRSLAEEEWVVVDVETTGRAPAGGHRITEIAAVAFTAGEIRGSYSSLVNPGRRIPSMITSLTGITDAMVRDAPLFTTVAPRLARALEGRVFVAHNAAFDWRFVSAELHTALGRHVHGRRLCTVRLARRLLPELPSRALGALAVYFGVHIESHHRALDDATATAKILGRLLEMCDEQGVRDWHALQALLSRRTPRRRVSRMPRSVDSA